MGKINKIEAIPDSVMNLIKYGISLLNPEKVILFGSRARGDFHDLSDFDLAFKFESSKKNDELWQTFLSEIHDGHKFVFTLFRVDILHYEKTREDLRKKIDSEGVVVYE